MTRWLLAAVLLAPIAAHAQALTYADRGGTITTGGIAQTLAPAWTGRHGCAIQNLSATDLWVNVAGGTAAATQPSFKLSAGSQFICDTPAPAAAISIFGATTGQAFAANEW